ncbi:MAG: peptidylprolyl isomerase, partial [Ectopseudomonas oleovorans]
VKAFDDKQVTIDFNHPLAGKTLQFDVEIIEVKALDAV